ncbi:IclR family transcriptional regulator [Telmatospirillum sp.]|uniref:IclR family transcriptional regulator n=1 Tax=Telmatospirillum sp. TaxID=2079197 RepID=UPI002843D719|nr:IclR family transcriptional regulator [Telmatospirillum sp.]MDR3435098.1 IclR family transcriptional regulator [Telmatospirillum sp.]
MSLPQSSESLPPSDDGEKAAAGAQTLVRGLTLLELVAEGVDDVKGLSERLHSPRSTVHRVLSNLVAQGYLHHAPHQAYTLGYKLIYLGGRAREQSPVALLARPHLEILAKSCGDTVHLGEMDGSYVLYLDKLSGGKGLEMRSRIGQRMPLASTGVGKALMLGLDEDRWRDLYDEALALKQESGTDRPFLPPWPDYLETMRNYRQHGWVMDFEENEVGIRCVGAPIRDVTGHVVAAISIASANFYMSEDRMRELGPTVAATAMAISKQLGATATP